MERARFEHDFPKDCETKIADYLNWRQAHQLDKTTDNNDDNVTAAFPTLDTHSDAELWQWALQKAWVFHKPSISASTSSTANVEQSKSRRGFRKLKQQRDNTATSRDGMSSAASSTMDDNDAALDTDMPRLPQVVYCHRNNNKSMLCDKQGHLLLHVLAARLDPTLAGNKLSNDLYTTSLALYLDRYLNPKHRQDAQTNSRVTLLLDVRAGLGWHNPPALELVGLVRHLATNLHALYPNRLQHCLLFPVPRPAIWIWNTCKGLLDERIRTTVQLFPGGAMADSPAPVAALSSTHVDATVLEHCEQVRLQTFVE